MKRLWLRLIALAALLAYFDARAWEFFPKEAEKEAKKEAKEERKKEKKREKALEKQLQVSVCVMFSVLCL